MREEEIKKDVIGHMIDLKERLRYVSESAKLNREHRKTTNIILIRIVLIARYK